MVKAKAPFKRKQKLAYWNPSTGHWYAVTYVKWMGPMRSPLVVVERDLNKFRMIVHVNYLQPRQRTPGRKLY